MFSAPGSTSHLLISQACYVRQAQCVWMFFLFKGFSLYKLIISLYKSHLHKWTNYDIYLGKSNEIRGETTNVTEMEAIKASESSGQNNEIMKTHNHLKIKCFSTDKGGFNTTVSI